MQNGGRNRRNNNNNNNNNKNKNDNKNKNKNDKNTSLAKSVTCRGYINVDLNRVTQNDKDRLEMVEKVTQWYRYALDMINWPAVYTLNSWANKLNVPPELVRVFRDLYEARSQMVSYAPMIMADLDMYRNNVGVSFSEFFSDATSPNRPLDIESTTTEQTTYLFINHRLNVGGTLSLTTVMLNNREALLHAVKTLAPIINTLNIATRLDFHDVTKSFFAHFADRGTPTSQMGGYTGTVTFTITSKSGNIRVTSVLPYSDYVNSYNSHRPLVETTADIMYSSLSIKQKSRRTMKSLESSNPLA